MREDLFYGGIALLIVGIIFIILGSYFSDPLTHIPYNLNYLYNTYTFMHIWRIFFWLGVIFMILGIVFIPIGAVLPGKDFHPIQNRKTIISESNKSNNQFIFCSNCGSRNFINQKYCEECGNKII